MALRIGNNAPDFTLPSSDRSKVSLSSYKGKNVVLLFFPFAFTGVCTKELCEMRDNLSMYESLDAEILAISVDAPATLAAFKEAQQYNFNLLSDFNKQVSIQYDVLYPVFAGGLKGVSKRAAFVVDASGKIRYAEILENAGELPNFAAIQQLLQTIKDS
ncbi:MAG: redoxin domain-containing protein [Saprospiraceae bacterium]